MIPTTERVDLQSLLSEDSSSSITEEEVIDTKQKPNLDSDEDDISEPSQVQPAKPGRGRPRKAKAELSSSRDKKEKKEKKVTTF